MNRRKLMLLNSIVVLLTTIINVVFGLIEVKLFISKFGTSINGLMQTGNQILSYVALMEAGISASFVYSFYKTLSTGNSDQISALYKGFQNSLIKTVLMMLCGALSISLIYPLFLIKEGLGYWFMVLVFALLSIKTILPYFLIYVPKYMIIAREQKYKTDLINCFSKSLTYVGEILLIIYTDVSIFAILLISIAISIASGLIYQKVMRRSFGELIKKDVEPDYSPKKRSKDVLPHNISSLVFNSTDNIILSIFCSLNIVTIYSNYNLIISQMNLIFQGIFDGATSSFGAKIAKKDDNSYQVYKELLSITLFVASIIFGVFSIMINDFISIWVGASFLVDDWDVLLFAFILYFGIIIPCLTAARNACGLYKESKNFVIMQAVVNLVLTVVLTPFIGLTGALLGTFIARLLITVPCNYFLVEKKVFSQEKNNIYELIIPTFFTLCITVLIKILLEQLLFFSMDNQVLLFVLKAFGITCVFFGAFFVLYWLINKNFRNVIRKFFSRLRRKNG